MQRHHLTDKGAVLCCAALSRLVVSNSLRPLNCSPSGSSVHGDSPGKNTGVGCNGLLQGLTKVHLVKAMGFAIVMYECENWIIRKSSTEELMLLNCGVGEDS